MFTQLLTGVAFQLNPMWRDCKIVVCRTFNSTAYLIKQNPLLLTGTTTKQWWWMNCWWKQGYCTKQSGGCCRSSSASVWSTYCSTAAAAMHTAYAKHPARCFWSLRPWSVWLCDMVSRNVSCLPGKWDWWGIWLCELGVGCSGSWSEMLSWAGWQLTLGKRLCGWLMKNAAKHVGGNCWGMLPFPRDVWASQISLVA